MGTGYFENLEVWKSAHALTLDIYKITKSFPMEENYRISNQLCRSSSSICANIAEGNARGSLKDYLRFLYIARGSLEETRYFLILSKDLEYLSLDQYKQLLNHCIHISKMLNGLIKSLHNK